MPELPEIESLVRSLQPIIPGKTIVRAQCGQPKAIKPSVKEFETLAKGRVESVHRRAKSFIFKLGHGSIWFHVGLRGRVIYEPPLRPYTSASTPPEGATVSLAFSDGSRFSIVRSFMGHAHFLSPSDSEKEWNSYGKEPLDQDFTIELFLAILERNSKQPIKAILMDQSSIAGIGNYYSDEILHAAYVHPAARPVSIASEKRSQVYDSIRSVLARAIELRGEPEWIGLDGQGGRYVAQIHGRPDCGRCGGPSQTISIHGRTGYFCPACQPL